MSHSATPSSPLPTARSLTPLSGFWSGGEITPISAAGPLLAHVAQPAWIVDDHGVAALATGGQATFGSQTGGASLGALPIRGYIPVCRPENLGDRAFCDDHGLSMPYVAGAMANGIASVELVQAMGRAGMLGVFGAAGLSLAVVEKAIDRLGTRLAGRPWATNLIHSPYEPAHEEAVVDLYLRRGVSTVSASAFLGLTLPLVRFRLSGIGLDSAGHIHTPHKVIGKVSRAEVAEHFLSPAPAELIGELVRRGDLSETQAEMARHVPVAQDLVVEADSGGHTDNRPALTLFPGMATLARAKQALYDFAKPLRVGLAGGISTPHAAAGAFAMGAAFVLTGSVNQATLEAGTSDIVRKMLAQAGQADVKMAPAADMFEMGVDLQVLSRGTLFPMRARRLRELYEAHASLDELPAADKKRLEGTILGCSIDEAWAGTASFWADRDPAQLARAESDPKHKMALLFRWYLGSSSRWANAGDPARVVDYQVWCGPAMGAFNEWARGSLFEPWENRRAMPIAHNILWGASALTRLSALRNQGVPVSVDCLDLTPREPAVLEELLS
ncbi:MAG: trans-AT polyketide synthase/acyltransferase/oxidoreductase domain-containing protein [Pseudohongiellaceae bacterium]|jgi:trans-AT polyketide synthase/acyltransferase/oxidoreductase domain-containing protein